LTDIDFVAIESSHHPKPQRQLLFSDGSIRHFV